MFMIHKATVLWILGYGCPVYGSAFKALLKTLDPEHNQGLRLCTGAFRSSPAVSITAESGEPPL